MTHGNQLDVSDASTRLMKHSLSAAAGIDKHLALSVQPKQIAGRSAKTCADYGAAELSGCAPYSRETQMH